MEETRRTQCNHTFDDDSNLAQFTCIFRRKGKKIAFCAVCCCEFTISSEVTERSGQEISSSMNKQIDERVNYARAIFDKIEEKHTNGDIALSNGNGFHLIGESRGDDSESNNLRRSNKRKSFVLDSSDSEASPTSNGNDNGIKKENLRETRRNKSFIHESLQSLSNTLFSPFVRKKPSSSNIEDTVPLSPRNFNSDIYNGKYSNGLPNGDIEMKSQGTITPKKIDFNGVSSSSSLPSDIAVINEISAHVEAPSLPIQDNIALGSRLSDIQGSSFKVNSRCFDSEETMSVISDANSVSNNSYNNLENGDGQSLESSHGQGKKRGRKKVTVDACQPCISVIPTTSMSDMMKEITKHMSSIGQSIEDNGKTLNVSTMQLLFAKGFDPNMRFKSIKNQTPLHISAANGDFRIVSALVHGGADIDIMDSQWQTPLMVAIEHQQNVIVGYLVSNGAQLHLKNKFGMTVLHTAVKYSNLEACSTILESTSEDLNINAQDNGGWTPLMWATDDKLDLIAKLLIEKGCDLDIVDNKQNSSLHWSAYYNCRQVCEMLLDNDSNISLVNCDGDTALHIAVKKDSYECALLLLSKKAKTNVKNKDGKYPTDYAPAGSKIKSALKNKDKIKEILIEENIMFKQEVILHRDISYGKEQRYPIQCVNDVDSADFPEDFLYGVDIAESSSIYVDRSLTSLSGCNCKDDCSSGSCSCTHKLNVKCWYEKERLLEDFDFNNIPTIYECNYTCRCWNTCRNRLVQNGIRFPLQLFRTKTKGWGVRVLRDAPRGTFISEYVGELITIFQARKRQNDRYLFDLHNQDGDCIDAHNYGNISRFINHSCDPNIEAVEVFINHHDKRYPRFAFFSRRDIKAYEEIGFDYGKQFWKVMTNLKCNCGSSKCRYQLEMKK